MMLLKLSGKIGEKSIEFQRCTKYLLFVNSVVFKMFVHLQTISLHGNQVKLFSSLSELAQQING